MALIDVDGKRFKNFMSKLYGWGAAVVIMGALFKIIHLPGADAMLIIGLTTEADKMMEEAKIGPELLTSLGDGMRKLSDTASSLNSATDAAGATSAYSEQLNSAAKNMEALNALYAVQLENTTSQVEIQNSLMEKLGSSMDESEALEKLIATALMWTRWKA